MENRLVQPIFAPLEQDERSAAEVCHEPVTYHIPQHHLSVLVSEEQVMI
jgi:hypothetical protein